MPPIIQLRISITQISISTSDAREATGECMITYAIYWITINMDVRHLIMDTCDLIYIHRPIMIFMIEVRTSIIFFFFFSQGCEWMECQKRIIVDMHAYL